ncbi:MAG: glycine cleavage system protein GcvH [Desulfovibrio sp.]|jgi:glycine cleavage system H protein|nr:glycine cleavage system protein GcvH [Desulfovibrio sp.]
MAESKDLRFPDTLKYHAEHEWISASAPYLVGISDFAQDQLGDLTYVELPETGRVLARGEEFGTLESTKSVSPLFSPVAGVVAAVNEELADDPGLPNADPYGRGWIIEIRPENPAELDELMDAGAYKKFLETARH